MVYADSKYNFFPITDEYKRNNYVLDNFVLDEASSRITYTDDVGEVHSKTGIDVSKHQGKIDWEKVAADGVSFAMIRVGYYKDKDPYFDRNVMEAAANGVKAGEARKGSLWRMNILLITLKAH